MRWSATTVHVVGISQSRSIYPTLSSNWAFALLILGVVCTASRRLIGDCLHMLWLRRGSIHRSRLQPKLRIWAPAIAISETAPRSYAGRWRSGAVRRGRSLPVGAKASPAEPLRAVEACAFHLVLHAALLISLAWVRSPSNFRIYRGSDIAMSRPTKSSMCLASIRATSCEVPLAHRGRRSSIRRPRVR